MSIKHKRMTVGQALVEFLGHQWTVDGGVRERTVPGVFGIFGHGNLAELGQANAAHRWVSSCVESFGVFGVVGLEGFFALVPGLAPGAVVYLGWGE